MAKSFLVPINLNQLELQNARIQNLASAPTSPVKGQVYFNTTTNKAMVYDGTNWVPWEADTNSVTGVKGSSESTYRTGNVSISAANIGLGNVTDGAEVNQNAFSNVKVGSTTIAADTKTDTLELTAGSNVTLTPDATNDKVTIAATDTTYSSGTSTELTNGTVTNDRVWTPKILHDYVASAIGGVDAMRFKGTIGTGGTITTLPTSGVKVGDTYRVITAGTYGGHSCEIGDLIIATATTPTWVVAQTNITGISKTKDNFVIGGSTTSIPNISKKTVVTGVTKKTVVTGGSTTDIPNVTSVGSAPTLGTAIAADDITSWSAGTLPAATYNAGVLTFTVGTLPSLAYTERSIPNVTSVGSAPTLGTVIKGYTSLTTGDSVTVTTGDSVTVGTPISAYTSFEKELALTDVSFTTD